jgi:hypothetical protein
MTMMRIFSLCTILGFACIASPATAGDSLHAADVTWWRAHHAIYHLENLIAYLQANPDVDESCKGPIIEAVHARILRLRAAIGPRRPHWPTPCCYSRKPIYIR